MDGGNTPWHCCDIPYVFHNIDLVEYPHGPGETGLAERIQEEAFGAVMAFAAKGDPACGAVPARPACEPGKERVLVLDGNTRVLENYDHELMRVMEKYSGEIIRRMSAGSGEIQH